MSVTIPVTATLAAGTSYRIGFYVETTPLSAASGALFQPGAFPYVEDAGVFRINSAHAVGANAFPANPNLFAPQMTIEIRCP